MALGYDPDDGALVAFQYGPCVNQLLDGPNCDMKSYTLVVSNFWAANGTYTLTWGTHALPPPFSTPFTTWGYATSTKMFNMFRGVDNKWYVRFDYLWNSGPPFYQVLRLLTTVYSSSAAECCPPFEQYDGVTTCNSSPMYCTSWDNAIITVSA